MKKFTFFKGLIVLMIFTFLAVNKSSAQNLWCTYGNGNFVGSFTVSNGSYTSGPDFLFFPTYVGGSTGGSSTAALGRSDKTSQSLGAFYWLPNTGTNSGVVDVYGSTSTGGSQTFIGSLDVNGGGDADNIGFVRLGMGPDGTGWILARETNSPFTVYLAKFVTNPGSPLTPVPVTLVDNDVTLVGTTGADFLNGDLCVSGNGTIFALVNNGAGATHILVGSPNGASTILTKKWDLVDNTNNPFISAVNGVAFDAIGSMYISTSTGLFYINQATVNGPAGTVQCTAVHIDPNMNLQDLASNFFPNQTTLPVDLISFSGNMRNNIATLAWDADNEVNFDHYDIERSTNGSTYASVGSKLSLHSGIRASYQYLDNLSSVSGNIFYYRLKMVDVSGSYKYSSVILVRKDQSSIMGITMNPNPVVKGTATVRFTSSADVMVNIRIIDINGKEMLKQQNRVSEGTNSVSINNLDRLQQGTYLLQMDDGIAVSVTKFQVNR